MNIEHVDALRKHHGIFLTFKAKDYYTHIKQKQILPNLQKKNIAEHFGGVHKPTRYLYRFYSIVFYAMLYLSTILVKNQIILIYKSYFDTAFINCL